MLSLRSFITFAILYIILAAAQSGPGQFTLTIYQPGSALDGQVVNAAGSAFFLGGQPATYCPLANQTLCPAGNQTIFAGMADMFVSIFYPLAFTYAYPLGTGRSPRWSTNLHHIRRRYLLHTSSFYPHPVWSLYRRFHQCYDYQRLRRFGLRDQLAISSYEWHQYE